MTWTIMISGHDDLTGDEKVAYEEAVTEAARGLITTLTAMPEGSVDSAICATVSNASIDLLTGPGE